jgi:zinc/manganese transport system ATP-binding protein
MTLNLKNVTVSYDRHPAIHHVNGEFATGSMTAIAGPNGGGKSTLLKAVAGLVDLEQGRVSREASARLAFLPQISEINRDFPITIAAFLSSALNGKNGFFGTISEADKKSINAALDAVKLEGFGKRSLQSLSAGQFQRVLFARVILQNADVILLDEPFSAVDEKTLPLLLNMMQGWHDQKRTILCVLHDVDLIKRHFPQTLLIARDVIGWGPTAQILNQDNIRRLQGFHEAWRDQAEICAP